MAEIASFVANVFELLPSPNWKPMFSGASSGKLTQREFADSQPIASMLVVAEMDREGSPVAAPRTGWRLWTALVAAVLLIAQGFTSVSAKAAGPTPVVLDAFGNPICLAGYIAGGLDDNQRGSPPDCCAIHCCASTFSAGVLPKSGELIVGPFLKLPKQDLPVSPFLLAADGYLPGNPRAPPFSA